MSAYAYAQLYEIKMTSKQRIELMKSNDAHKINAMCY